MPTLPEPPTGSGTDWVQLDSGTYLGLCYAVIEMGSHQVTYQGVPRPNLTPQILLRWELPAIDAPPRDDGVVMPATIGKRYTWSMSEKANLRKDLENWRGARFEQRDFGPNGFEMFDIIGVAATLNVLRTEKNGKTYSDITSVGRVMKGMQIPALAHKPVKIGLNSRQFDREAFAALSDGIRKKIEDSPEYQALMRGHTARQNGYGSQGVRDDTWTNNQNRQSDAMNRADSGDLDDEIPF